MALKSELFWPKYMIDFSKALNVPENGISYNFKDALKWFFTVVFPDGLEVGSDQSYHNMLRPKESMSVFLYLKHSHYRYHVHIED